MQKESPFLQYYHIVRAGRAMISLGERSAVGALIRLDPELRERAGRVTGETQIRKGFP